LSLTIFRAAVNGFGLLEKPVDPIQQQLQILARHRRDLVKKESKLQCQIRHHLEQGLPGFIVRDLKRAAEQLPESGRLEEGAKLQAAALKARRKRQKGPQEPSTLLVAVLARPGIAAKDDDASKST